MKTGFNKKIEAILRKSGMRNGVGYVSPTSPKLTKHLRSLGYNVTNGIGVAKFDFIVLSKAFSNQYFVEYFMDKLIPLGMIVINIGNYNLLIMRKSGKEQ